MDFIITAICWFMVGVNVHRLGVLRRNDKRLDDIGDKIKANAVCTDVRQEALIEAFQDTFSGFCGSNEYLLEDGKPKFVDDRRHIMWLAFMSGVYNQANVFSDVLAEAMEESK